MVWQECKRCKRKILQFKDRSTTPDQLCDQCYEVVTGTCVDCRGTGVIDRAHLGTMECPRCEGSGKR